MIIEDLRTGMVRIGSLHLRLFDLQRLEPDHPMLDARYARREYDPATGYHGLLWRNGRGEDEGELPWSWGEYLLRRESALRARLEAEATPEGA